MEHSRIYSVTGVKRSFPLSVSFHLIRIGTQPNLKGSKVTLSLANVNVALYLCHLLQHKECELIWIRTQPKAGKVTQGSAGCLSLGDL